MTGKQAKELSLEVWTYLRDHPEIERKAQLPSELYDKISRLTGRCPLCEIFGTACSQCPLECCGTGSDFDDWCTSECDDEALRQKAAANIVKKIEDWEV